MIHGLLKLPVQNLPIRRVIYGAWASKDYDIDAGSWNESVVGMTVQHTGDMKAMQSTAWISVLV